MFKGYLLREARKKAGFTLKGLAEALEEEYGFTVVNYNTLSYWEVSPTATPREGNLKRVAEFLGIPVSELFDDCDDCNDNNKFRIKNEVDILSLIEKIIMIYKNDPDDKRIDKIRTLII